MATAASSLLRLRGAVERLPAGLRDHVFRVEIESEKLARVHGVDIEAARIAALGHDLARAESAARLLEMASERGLIPDEVEREEPILVHGPVAARILAAEYEIEDAEILTAIDVHTTAAPGMRRLEKVLFLADKIEPDKIERRPAWAEVRDLAASNLDAAMRRFLDLHLAEALERSWLIHPRTVGARNGLVSLARGHYTPGGANLGKSPNSQIQQD